MKQFSKTMLYGLLGLILAGATVIVAMFIAIIIVSMFEALLGG